MSTSDNKQGAQGHADLTDVGVIKPLMEDESVSDVLVNGANDVFVERGGKLEKTSITFPNEEAVRELAERIVTMVGRELNPIRPLVDARLADGSRVNVVAPPLAVDGTIISIRKFTKRKVSLDNMAAGGHISTGLAEFLKVAGKCRMNIIISGGTGSGKTTMMNALSEHIDHTERVVTIEDAAELQLQQPHVVRLETKPVMHGHDPSEEVSIRDLLRNALRMRPDRIIVGEVRGAEAFDMMQAMNTGHEGSLTTIHANHPRDAIARLENMISMANLSIPIRSVRAQIASALHLVIQSSRMRDGVRRVTYGTEIAGMEGDVVTMNELFTFISKPDTGDGKVHGEFKWSGILPRFIKRVAYYGELDRLGNALGIKIPKP
jgi:pilus assembly protein CpaF